MLIQHTGFCSMTLELQTLGLSEDKLNLVDFGDLEIHVFGRSYALTFDQTNGTLENNILSVSLDISNQSTCEETFPDCRFNLTEEDLSNPELFASININSPDDGIKMYLLEATLHYAHDEHDIKIKVADDNLSGRYNIPRLPNLNFIVLELCDNDFGSRLRSTLELFSEDVFKGVYCPITLKKAVIQHIIGLSMQESASFNKKGDIDWARFQHTEQYLIEKLRVTFEEIKPDKDHEGGSAYFDVSLNQCFGY